MGRISSTRSAVNGDRAWSANFGRFDELHGKLLEQAIQGHPAALLGDWRDFFDSIRVLNTSELDGAKVYIVKLRRGELPPATVYVHAETGDVLKSEGIALAKGGISIPVVTRFEDYREMHGIRIPFRTISSNESTGRTVVEYHTVETSLDIGDDIFTLSPPSEE